MSELLHSVLRGARPDLRAFVDALGHVVPGLDRFEHTEQDPEWHAEGDVFVHTQWVLDALYAELDSDLGRALSPEDQRDVVLGAVFHDLAKPWTTRRAEIRGVERVVAPRHEAKGRATLATTLVDAGLPWPALWKLMGVVGSHHEPKQLVVKDRGPGEHRRISRRVDAEAVAWVERADMRGRICPDRARQVEHVEMFSLAMAEYAPPGWHDAWRAHFAAALADRPAAFRDRVFGEAIRLLEADRIREPDEAGFLAFREPEAPPELVVLCGPSGSGKTTFVDRHLRDHEVVSLDALRDALAGDRSDQSLDGAVRQAAKAALKAALRPGRRVVWDATCLRADFRSAVCQTGFDYGALVTLVVFQQGRDATERRNREREHAVPARVLEAQLDSWEFPEVDEAHRLVVLDGDGRVRGAFGSCDEALPYGLERARP
jgi:predicted kinase